jgi:hypothetical protein
VTQVQGVVQHVRLDHEGSDLVLRFVLQVDQGKAIPVEMRGERLTGVLNDGDQVRVDTEAADVREPDGVARPDRVSNLSTSSVVELARLSRVNKAVGTATGLVRSVVIALTTGFLVTLLGQLLAARDIVPSIGQGGSEIPNTLLISLVLGALAGLIVFVVIYIVPRLTRD